MKERPKGYYISDIPRDRKVVKKLFDILQMDEELGSISGFLDLSTDPLFLFEDIDECNEDDPYWNWLFPPSKNIKVITCHEFLMKYTTSTVPIEDIYKQF